METKLCKKCNEIKGFERFTKNKNCVNGITSVCLDCKNKTQFSFRYSNRDSFNNKAKKYNQNFKIKNPNYNKNYSKNNLEKFREYNKKYREKYPEKIKARELKYRLDHIDELKEKSKKNRDDLADSYIKNHLKKKGFVKNHITTELIELQIVIIKTKRLCRQLKN